MVERRGSITLFRQWANHSQAPTPPHPHSTEATTIPIHIYTSTHLHSYSTVAKHATMDPTDCSHRIKLYHLPNELILEVLGHLLPIRGFFWSRGPEAERQLENAKRVKTLYHLSLTSQRLNALATPLLYQSLIWPAYGVPGMRALLKTIVATPELVFHTQYLEISPGIPTHRQDIYRAIFHMLIHPVENLVELAFSDFHNPHVPGVYQTNMDMLRRLWLTGHQKFPADMAISFPKVADGSAVSKFLHRLKMSVHALRWVGIGDSLSQHAGGQNGVDLESVVDVESIVLDNCNLSPTMIDYMLIGCSSLKKFTCRWATWPNDAVSNADYPVDLPVPIDLQRLRQNLSRFHNSLEHLDLKTLDSGWRIYLDGEILTIGDVRDLRDFSTLKHVEVPGLVLRDDATDNPPLASMLPTSLETLIIHEEWDNYVEDTLMALSKDAVSQLPRLKSVDCSCRPAPSQVAPLLIDMFAAVGVVLKLSTAEGA
jgi:hypothetical protein